MNWGPIKATRFLFIAAAVFFSQKVFAQSPVTLTVNTVDTGITVPPDFVGLSFGSATMQAYVNGTIGYFFASYDSEAVDLFRTLGIKDLRTAGGTTLWAEDGSLPARSDIDTFFGFVKEILGLRVIYSVPFLSI